MKTVTSSIEFDYSVTSSLRLHLGSEGVAVDDHVAERLTQVFGSRITVSEPESSPKEEESTQELEMEPSKDSEPMEEESTPSPKPKKSKKKKSAK